MADTTSTRLDRIEGKLDQLTEAMVAMARAEERIANLQDDHNEMRERMNRFSRKLDDIEAVCNENHRTITIINKLFWVVTVAVVGSIVSQLGVF